ESCRALREIWRTWRPGAPLACEGKVYRFTLMTPNFTPEPIDAPSPAITIAAVGPVMLKVAAEECDGLRLHSFCTRKYIDQTVMPVVAAGLAKVGRTREQFDMSG